MDKFDLILKLAPELAKIGVDAGKILSKKHGFIVNRVPAIIDGKKGDLVWDYLIWNEITFDTEDGQITSHFNSISDEETEKKWNELVLKYGV